MLHLFCEVSADPLAKCSLSAFFHNALGGGVGMQPQPIKLDNLLLDFQNPRTGITSTQSDAMKAIIGLSSRNFETMMESIREHGLDPGDAFYVIQDVSNPGDYIVVDGNRRLAALKVLMEPNQLLGLGISDAYRAKLASLSKDLTRDAFLDLPCVVFPDRSTANEWILRRHGRGMEGEARIPWGPLEIQRFQNDRTVLDVIDFVEKNSTYPNDRWTEIKAEVEKKSSVLRRFLEAKPVKDLLGFSTKMEEGITVPEFTSNPASALDTLTTIFNRIAAGSATTRTFNKNSDFQKFVSELPDTLQKPERSGSKAFKDVEVRDGTMRPRQAQAASTTKATKTTKVRKPRATLAPAHHPFKQPASPKGQQLLYEASKLKLEPTPLAAAYLFRAFIEHTIDIYIEQHSIPDRKPRSVDRLDLKGRAELVLDHLKDAGTVNGNDLRGTRRVLTNTKDSASIQALNDYHHNKFHLPTVEALRNAWNTCEALFIGVYGQA